MDLGRWNSSMKVLRDYPPAGFMIKAIFSEISDESTTSTPKHNNSHNSTKRVNPENNNKGFMEAINMMGARHVKKSK